MNTDLLKRLEKAADDFAEKHGFRVPYNGSNDFYDKTDVMASKDGFLEGAEYGYKEAIKVAKEWLRNNVHRYIYAVNEDGIPQAGIGAAVFAEDFEKDMNKLWEETK